MIATTTTTAMATTTKTGGRGSQPFSKRIRLPELNPIGLPAGDTENLRRDYSQRIETVYTNDLGSAEAWVEKHLGMSHRNADSDPLILGWDTESTPYLPWLEHRYDSGTYFGPATIQLGTPTSSLVLQVAEDGFGPIHEGGLPSFLSDVLEDPGIIPVGVGLDDDMVELYRWCLDIEQTNGGDGPPTPAWAGGETDNGSDSDKILRRFDMGGIGSSIPGRTTGLAKLVLGILGVELVKTKKLSRTHWSTPPPLRPAEVSYAARDAWAGAAIMERLGDLDPGRFSPAAIGEALERQLPGDGDENGSGNDRHQHGVLRGIREVSDRKIVRAGLRKEWKEMKNPLDEDGNEKPKWTEAEHERNKVLQVEMRKLAPTPPMVYEIKESLGIGN